MTSVSAQLEQDLSWREGELASLKVLAANLDQQSARYRTLLRALWCLLYAHYEGFFKFSWDLYLESMEQLRIPRSQATQVLIQFSLRKKYREMKKDLSDDSLWRCFSIEFDLWMQENLEFPTKLETKSNLWPSVARENLKAIGLPCVEIDAHERNLHALVRRRNEIAHGKPLVIKTLAEYQPYEDSAVGAMHELALAVLDSLENRTYLASS